MMPMLSSLLLLVLVIHLHNAVLSGFLPTKLVFQFLLYYIGSRQYLQSRGLWMNHKEGE